MLALFEEVASSLEFDGISFGKLEIESNPETKGRYQITEVPDVRIFRRGVMFYYQGPGDQEGAKGTCSSWLFNKYFIDYKYILYTIKRQICE